ncbi:hypothetical protein HDK64DRAFT_339862 [Phyllosticta capitalensis]
MATPLNTCDADQLGGGSGKKSLEEIFPLEDSAVDFSEFLESGDLSDITVTFPDGSEHAAHRLVLSARSSYFKDMVEAELEGPRGLSLNLIWGINSESLKALLKYIYSQKYPKIPGSSGLLKHATIFQLGEYYRIQGLRYMAYHKFVTSVTKEELLERLASIVSVVDWTFLKLDDRLRDYITRFCADEIDELLKGDGIGRLHHHNATSAFLLRVVKLQSEKIKTLKAQLEEKKLRDASPERDNKTSA